MKIFISWIANLYNKLLNNFSNAVNSFLAKVMVI